VPANGNSWDAAGALERLGGDADLFREIIQIFLQEAPKHMTELQEALVHEDRAATERIAHTLKGELACLGVLQASQRRRTGGCRSKRGLRARCQRTDIA